MFQYARAHSDLVLLTEDGWSYVLPGTSSNRGIHVTVFCWIFNWMDGILVLFLLETFCFLYTIPFLLCLTIIELMSWSEDLQRCDCKCKSEPGCFVWWIKKKIIKQSQQIGTSGLTSKSELTVVMVFTAFVRHETSSCSHLYICAVPST